MKEWVQELVQGASSFEVRSTADLYAAPPVEFLVEGIIPLYSAVGLTGYPGTGKTWTALEMMRAVATGTPFLGKYPVKRAPVLFVGNDASYHDYAQQWRRLTKDEFDGYEEDRLKGLRDLNPFDSHAHFLIQSDFNLDDVHQVIRLIKTSQEVMGDVQYEITEDDDGNRTIVDATQSHFGLIVLDTLSKMTKSSENSNTERDACFEMIRLLAESTGATVLVLHHNTQPSEFRTGEEWRGGSAQIASLDCHFHLTAKNKGLIEFKTKKMRGITPPTFNFLLDVHQEGAASLDYHDNVQPDQGTEILIAEMIEVLKKRDNRPTTKSDFAQVLLAAHSTEFDDIKKLKKFIDNTLFTYTRLPDAKIVQAVRGSGGRPAQYKLAFTEANSEGERSTGPDLAGTEESGD